MARLTVLVGENVGEANLTRLRQKFPEVRFVLALTPEEMLVVAPEADVIFTKSLRPEVLRAASRLRWVQAGVSGVERMLAAGLRERDVLLTNARGAHGVPIAEFIVGMMLAFATGLHTLVRAQPRRARVFDPVVSSKFELEGQRLCVLGAGDIGGTLARKARALGMRVSVVRRSGAPLADADDTHPWDRLLELLPLADHVALCLPLTAETAGLIGERELRAMNPTAYVYNVGRGRSIDPDALVRALQEGWIAGAGLDVTTPEPLPEDSPLWDMPNVILGQHTSGSSPLNAGRITAIFLENLGRYLRQEPLINLVDPRRGY
ncbi:MAG: D-2-hydroxyacid dehydrogenase [Sphingomonadaceae bacterium]